MTTFNNNTQLSAQIMAICFNRIAKSIKNGQIEPPSPSRFHPFITSSTSSALDTCHRISVKGRNSQFRKCRSPVGSSFQTRNLQLPTRFFILTTSICLVLSTGFRRQRVQNMLISFYFQIMKLIFKKRNKFHIDRKLNYFLVKYR